MSVYGLLNVDGCIWIESGRELGGGGGHEVVVVGKTDSVWWCWCC